MKSRATENDARHGDVVIYQTEDGKTALDVRLEGDTVWLSQTQMVTLFKRDQSVISRHINSVFKDKELDAKSNMQKMHIADSDKPVAFYSLNTIISVGYRVKSKRGTQFRIWATQILRDHLTRGYTLNQQRFEHNARELEAALELVREVKPLLLSFPRMRESRNLKRTWMPAFAGMTKKGDFCSNPSYWAPIRLVPPHVPSFPRMRESSS